MEELAESNGWSLQRWAGDDSGGTTKEPSLPRSTAGAWFERGQREARAARELRGVRACELAEACALSCARAAASERAEGARAARKEHLWHANTAEPRERSHFQVVTISTSLEHPRDVRFLPKKSKNVRPVF